MRIDLSCPVENRGVTVKTSTKNNETYALLRLFNLSQKVITDISFDVKAYDAYGKELGVIPVSLSDVDGQPRSFFATTKAVSLMDYEEAKHIVVDVTEVTFDDGEIYTPGEIMDITVPEPDYGEKMLLLQAAGDDAECYSQDPGRYWLCVCGRPNKQEDERCVRCDREKDMVLEKFSTRERLNKAAQERDAELQRLEMERQLKLEQEKEEKRKKAAKTSLVAVFVIVCLAVLGTIGYFSYGFVVTKIADGKASKGDYLGAYELYNSVNSKNIGNASEFVRGNSASNLTNSGIMAVDDENIYYINTQMNIIKENKSTSEKMQLGKDKSIYLNVVGDYVYYLNLDDQQKVYRISKDGNTTEEVVDQQAFGLYVVGNDIYYITTETVSSAGQAQQQQQQQPQQIPVLFTKKIGDKTATKVTSESIQTFVPYKGKIYYVNEADDKSIYVMDKDGKNAAKVVSGPAPMFDIKDDIIYYIDYTVADQSSNMPKLSLEKSDLKGSYIGTAIPEAQVTSFIITDTDIYFMDYAQGMQVFKQAINGGEKTLISEQAYSVFNVADKTLFYLSGNGEMVKANLDGSEIENLGPLQ